ncbi:MAG TPA: zinc ABC transporter substrate-binding protein, partial [Thermoanaerobaculia bacterium]|nr:zinc ABC transporter substrate-binding protein [Thermoanaerobaculia bacterium]
MPKIRLHSIELSLLVVLALAGCGKVDSPGAANGPLKVVTTTGIIGDVAQRIAGEHARIESLMGPGVDPHLYKASESDV